MHQKPKKTGRLARRLAGLLLTAVLLMSTLSMAAWAADSYTSVTKGTVSWQMIYENAGTYYWKDSSGAYCALTAAKSGSSYCVTLKTSSTGSKVCYLRQTKSSTATKIQKWSGASGVYTGGVLYKKTSTGSGDSGSSSSGSGSGSSSGGSSSGGTSSTGTVAADGTYKANGTVSFSKDNYSFTLTLTVSGGKIASMSQTITTSTQESKSKSEYQPKAMTALSSALVGKAATTASVDAVSSGTPKYSFAALKAAARNAIASAAGSSSGSGSGSGSEGGYTPVTESEIGKGVGAKTGTKYTGKGTIADEYITLDVYVSGGKITGLFIADEVGDWLSLLTQESANYIGKSAALADVNAVSSATTLGFRNTIRDAVANAVAKADTGSGSSSGSASTSYKVDGYDKKYSYSALNTGNYYYLYKGTYYQVKGLKYYSKDKGKYFYCGYFTMNGVRYYLDDKPQAYSSSELSDEHPGDDSASKAYESCEKSKVSKGKELPLYVVAK